MNRNHCVEYGLVNKVTKIKKEKMYSRYYPRDPIFPPKNYTNVQRYRILGFLPKKSASKWEERSRGAVLYQTRLLTDLLGLMNQN